MNLMFSESEKENAASLINLYILRDYNSRNTLGSANGKDMPQDLHSVVLYEATFQECTWGNSDMTDLSGDGSRFVDCDFYTAKIHNASFQHAMFSGNVLYNCDLIGSNFSYGTFFSTFIRDSNIYGCSFVGTVFRQLLLENCAISSSNFELCRFQNSFLKDLTLQNLTLKYASFENVEMKNVGLPFLQLPYTFGGLKYALTTSDSIRIVTSNPDHPSMSMQEYHDLLQSLLVFFTENREYFPLTNCCLVLQEWELAAEMNEAGITQSAALHNFRQLYLFCLQAVRELNLSKERIYQLYGIINQNVSSAQLSRAEYYQFSLYYPMIKRLMFDNPHNRPVLILSLHTNIPADDYPRLGLLMRTLDEIAESYGVKLDSKHIEIRHNSPNILDWFPTGAIEQLLHLLKRSWEVLYPILSSALQDTANTATLVTGLYNFRKFWKGRASIPQSLEQQWTKASRSSESKPGNKIPSSHDHMKALETRIELLKYEKKQQLSRDECIPFSDCNPASISEKFNRLIEELKEKQILIDKIEIQLLDGEYDTLDYLYHEGPKTP